MQRAEEIPAATAAGLMELIITAELVVPFLPNTAVAAALERAATEAAAVEAAEATVALAAHSVLAVALAAALPILVTLLAQAAVE